MPCTPCHAIPCLGSCHGVFHARDSHAIFKNYLFLILATFSPYYSTQCFKIFSAKPSPRCHTLGTASRVQAPASPGCPARPASRRSTATGRATSGGSRQASPVSAAKSALASTARDPAQPRGTASERRAGPTASVAASSKA
jgi:hypothetical protein